jgi:hypothetical protein
MVKNVREEPRRALGLAAFDGFGSVWAVTDSADRARTLYSYKPYGETSASGPAPKHG